MLITKIEEQKKNKKKCNIFIDGEYYCSIDADIIKEVNIYEGMNIMEQELNKKIEVMNYKSTLKSALSMLMRAPRTENELAKKLKQKDFPDSTIEKVIDYLRSIGYVNDESYAESLIRDSKDNKGCSRRSLYYKLCQKGIDSKIIQQKLEEADIDEFDSALRTAIKKASSLKGNKRDKAKKLYSFLIRKGFGMEVCSKVISELKLEDDDTSNFTEFCE